MRKIVAHVLVVGIMIQNVCSKLGYNCKVRINVIADIITWIGGKLLIY